MNRDIAPLRQADDAVLVDATAMDIDQVVATVREIYERAAGKQ